MTDELVDTEMCESIGNLEHTLNGAFLAARLLTGSIGQAETAVQEAIESWDPDEDAEEALFQQVLKAAVRFPAEFAVSNWGISNWREAGSPLPAELQAVLRLSPRFRQCFVLRILLGQPPEVCARLLGLSEERVDEYTCAGLKSLADLSPVKFEQLAFTQPASATRIRWTD